MARISVEEYRWESTGLELDDPWGEQGMLNKVLPRFLLILLEENQEGSNKDGQYIGRWWWCEGYLGHGDNTVV